ncbi:hypothetical protein BHE74_00000470 [Ensete ventricosum]|nr:hypothetical protein GW17_00029065 [Ensete ventricosum]RWW90415.1 hypothetical protein BHE74_00000470 [Ensete ventricosum]
MVLVDRVAFSGPLKATLGVSLRGVSCDPRVSLQPAPWRLCTGWHAGASRAWSLAVTQSLGQESNDKVSGSVWFKGAGRAS